MKKIFISLMLFMGVSQPQILLSQTKTADFTSYINSLTNVRLPFDLYSWNNTLFDISPRYSKKEFQMFRSVSATKPGGIVTKNSKYVVIMDFNVSDGGMNPFLTSYDLKGNKIDSLVPFTKTSADQGFYASERLVISADKKISILDTTKTWKDNNAGKMIKSSLKIKHGETHFSININAKFLRR